VCVLIVAVYVMALSGLGLLSYVTNSTFLSGVVCGVSVAWLLLKNQSKIVSKKTEFSLEDSTTFGEVSCFRTVVFYKEKAHSRRLE
jgi:hypothetical protein